MITSEKGIGDELPATTPEELITSLFTPNPTADPVQADMDTLIENAKREATYNPLIVVSICVGLIRILSQK